MSKTGFIGLGIMGRPMAHHLLKKGFSLVVNDLNREAEDDLVAVGAARGTCKEIGEACDVIFTILPDGEIVQQVLFSEEGVAAALTPGKLVCDMSSVTPAQSRECYRRLKEAGAGFVDAPVSGGEPGAVNGTLAVMCGGEEADFNRLQPYFGAFSSSAVLVGESGAGSVTKLANQIMVNLNICAVSEALVLAAKAGVDPMRVYRAVRGGLAGSAVLHAKAPMICERDFVPGGKISINHKDIKNVLAAAHEMDVPLPFTAQLFEVQQVMKAHGMMGEDHCAYVKYFERLADVQVRSGGADGTA